MDKTEFHETAHRASEKNDGESNCYFRQSRVISR